MKQIKKPRDKSKLWMFLLCATGVFMLCLTAVFLLRNSAVGFLESFSRPLVKDIELSDLNSHYLVLMQNKGAKVIGSWNARERMYPASLTKMMTAIIGIEKLDPEKEITLTEEMLADLPALDVTQAGFQAGETVRVLDLLYGVLLPSGADCCRALSYHISGTEEDFVKLMNRKAKRIGMRNTHFCNSIGVHDEEHYSTAYDMALLLKYCLKNDLFREIIMSPWHSTPGTNLHPDGITYYSSLFNHLSSPEVTGGEILGGKTGFTNAAGLCLASFARVGGREYILVSGSAPGNTGNPLHVWDAIAAYDRLGQALEGM